MDQGKKVVVVDYGLGNLFSVEQACQRVGMNTVLSSKKEDLVNADAIILPGVGAFSDAMINLEKLDLVHPILDFIKQNKPFMGICLGMQLLFDFSEEFGVHQGLGIIKGGIKRFPETFGNSKNRIPQIAWNHITGKQSGWNKSPLQGIEDGSLVYFVHSYYAEPSSNENILCITKYNEFKYCSGIRQEMVFGLQFHPEKSGNIGLEIYRNFKNLIE